MTLCIILVCLTLVEINYLWSPLDAVQVILMAVLQLANKLNTQIELQRVHFSGISGNLEMLGNSIKVSEMSEKGQGICVVKEILLWHLNKLWYEL